jgi:cytochrome c-type biogenesis protein CcmH/NrfG
VTTLPAGPDLAVLSDDELVEERDFLLRSLRDLDEERQAGDVDEDDFIVLKEGYTARAAAVLRLLDGRRDGDDAGDAPEPAARPPRRRGRTVMVGAVVAMFAVGAGLLVARGAGQRLPGDTVSGSAPNNRVQQLLAQAGADVQNNNILGALKAFQQVLATDPRNVEALAGQGWLVAITGNTAHDRSLLDRGLATIRTAEQVDPSYASAHFFAGSILLDEGDAKGAVVEFQQYLADDPSSPQAALVRKDLQTAQALAAGTLPPGASVVPAATTTTP